jgi:hypothetical protein
MKRFHRILPLVVLGCAAALAARADENARAGPHGRPGPGIFHVEHCLSTLDLPAEQHVAIQSSLNAGKATLKADHESLKALHQKMEADIAAGADKAVLGQNVLDQQAARAKVKGDMQAIHDQVVAQLSSDQQQAFDACTAAAKAWHSGPGPAVSH